MSETSVDVSTLAAQVSWPDHTAETRARAQSGGLGKLDQLVEFLAGVQGRYPVLDLTRARLVIFAGDHGVAGADISAQAPDATATALRALADGSSPVCGLAETFGAGIRAVDVSSASPGEVAGRVRIGSGRIDTEDAASRSEIEQALRLGVSIADQEVDAGADLLIAAGIGVAASTPAAVLLAVLTNTEPVKTVGRGSGITDGMWMRKAAVIRDARLRAWPYRADPIMLLAAAGGADFAALGGFVLRAAARRTPVLLDGLSACAAAAVVALAQPRVSQWLRPAQLTPEPAHAIALTKLGLLPVLDLGVSRADGSCGLLALPLLRAAIQLRSASAALAEVPADLSADV
ncbi:MAG TPA: nicotinate-nucleotide--dimethylbenzimidazole phosphoribosyltransferase [Jatrophihabitantaceae bacterium]|nr:nicotinate-nucleotide--dimethylbenzimidazole phosphoribosyltransferase [Jatrophihabitantaceae bacterium]